MDIDEDVLEEVYNNMVDESTRVNEYGIINFESFLKYTHTLDTPFVRKVFDSEGMEDYEVFDLEMFIAGLSSFCITTDDASLGLFVFKLYLEEEFDAELSAERFAGMVTDMHGSVMAEELIKYVTDWDRLRHAAVQCHN